jgi:rod shape-determining protein MreC
VAVYRRGVRPRLLLVLLVLTSAILVTADIRGGGGGWVSSVRNGAQDAFAPVRSGVSSVVSPVTDFFRGVFQYRTLAHQNALLRQQLVQKQADQVAAVDAQREQQDLLDLLKLGFVGDIPTVAARVIAGAESNFQLTIVIDRGGDAGVLKGMPVVAGAGLVGRVISASAHQSTVLLLTDPAASVGVEFAPSNAVGVATGQGSGRPLSVTLVDPAASTPVGAVAVSSGLAGSPYPRGVPVGKVATDVPDVGVQSHTVTIRPVVDLTQLSYVDVLVWTPQTTAVTSPQPRPAGPVPVTHP